jgi:beta-glucanase (GH16 family)
MDHHACGAQPLRQRALAAAICFASAFGCEHVNDIGALASSDDAAGVAPDASTPRADAGDAGWRLVFSDEFDAPAGSPLDRSKWNLEVGPDRDDSQLQYNSDRPENVSLDGEHLVITAREESPPLMGMDYSSGRINTRTLFEPMYGRFEARIKVPTGSGLLTQWWLLGNDWGLGPGQVAWPDCGDITILEYFGSESRTAYQEAFGPGFVDEKTWPFRKPTQLPADLAADFHVYAAEWEKDQIRWYIDGTEYLSATPGELPDGGAWVFAHPFFLILYLGVGGAAGPPGGGTTFPQSMWVDYVRVYTRPGK